MPKIETKPQYKIIGILDDESKFLLQCESELLKKRKVQAFITQDYEEALLWVERSMIDLLIADYDLKININGLQVLKKAKSITNNIKYSIITNHPDNLIEEACLNEGFDFISKSSASSIKNIVNNINSIPLVNKENQRENNHLIMRYKRLVEPLIQELMLFSSSEEIILIPGRGEISIEKLITEIQNESDLGLEYIDLWADSQSTIIQLKHQRKGRFNNVFKKKK
ncbi:MAG TPA: hypothetical protein DCR93_13295 [Cytophagales bacterium]|nr:hypothetical protein [Cytophagales bacterium]HAP60417.1 hypothetical protein [Cytophagales bacterium]